MKRYFLFFLTLAFAIVMNAQALYVGTYNIRNQNNDDLREGNGWPTRSKVICDMINFEQPAIFGTQEVLVGQLHDLLNGLDNYGYIGVGRDDGKEAGEYSAVFYKKDKLDLLNHGNFWLNETPDVPKLGWDAACIRICTWGQFKDRETKLKFFFFNLHMDHIGVVARREAAKLVISKIKEIAKGAPVILTGDFNVDQHDEIFGIFSNSGILRDAYTYTKQRFAENGTFNSFENNLKSDSRIDHVFVSKHFSVEHYGVLTNSYWTENAQTATSAQKGHDAPEEISLSNYTRRNPSDHYPVFVKLFYEK
jgi:endonuclease/exonuclease/phosphatase family metal-dependent hydrolase